MLNIRVKIILSLNSISKYLLIILLLLFQPKPEENSVAITMDEKEADEGLSSRHSTNEGQPLLVVSNSCTPPNQSPVHNGNHTNNTYDKARGKKVNSIG